MTANVSDLRRMMLVALLCAPVWACAGGGPGRTTDGSDAAADQSDLLADAEASAALNYRVAWQADLAVPQGERIRSLTRVGSHLAVVESAPSGNLLTLLDDATGRIVWRRQFGHGNEQFFPPILDEENGRLLFHSRSTLYLLSVRSGSVDQRFDLPFLANQRGLLANHRMLYGTPTGRIYVQSLRTGNHRRSYEMTNAITADPVNMDGLVLVVDGNGAVGVLNYDLGLVWKKFQPPWEEIVAQPDFTTDTALIASTDQKLYAFDRSTGELYWELVTEYPLTADPIAIETRVYQYVPKRGMLALDVIEGDILWEGGDLPERVLQRHGEDLLLRSSTGIVVAERDTGVKIREVPLPDVVEVVSPARQDGALYLVGTDGRVMRMNPRR